MNYDREFETEFDYLAYVVRIALIQIEAGKEEIIINVHRYEDMELIAEVLSINMNELEESGIYFKLNRVN
ncbi:hypothetical protein [uncultured phage_MedDCM-OCT-S28-C10]|uniref:Uncharacterized protein n=1 Tax=uncultured phage_MedDCM-OCT-S28-C10 TaxID=2741077 RepID=A0A6S4P8E7_9CAUD|nr:hypothetical protein HOQ60_gp43 [uncultured phage_MedDCM-OCT-S28-C10]BAQ94089.1 hypothetical protein [uncultured phage_MedDCM-OCT-S28-C10]BAR25291.1 hypothetical protein [uncultured Mediterranean phage uvMED]BAR25352.1 hypothetical protein [uncultured Mediterranean phage uvMED]